jgi:hypothetical protein
MRREALSADLSASKGLTLPPAERGRAGIATGVIHDRVAQAHRKLRHAGMSLFADPAPTVDPPETLLRSLFLVQQVEQALV